MGGQLHHLDCGRGHHMRPCVTVHTENSFGTKLTITPLTVFEVRDNEDVVQKIKRFSASRVLVLDTSHDVTDDLSHERHTDVRGNYHSEGVSLNHQHGVHTKNSKQFYVAECSSLSISWKEVRDSIIHMGFAIAPLDNALDVMCEGKIKAEQLVPLAVESNNAWWYFVHYNKTSVALTKYGMRDHIVLASPWKILLVDVPRV